MPEVFLSYARADGETLARTLRDRLNKEAPDIVIKYDRNLLEGGVGWWKQVAEAIEGVQFLILLMTPAALTSGNVEKEWRHARQQGVCVYPIKGAPDSELHFDRMPRWMRKAHFFDLRQEWPTFIAHLRKGCTAPRVPFMAPDLPAHFVARPSEFEALKGLLLSPDRSEPVAITTALFGAGGFGKTTLAAALCHHDDIVMNFDDGILWVTLGQTPDLIAVLLTLFAALTGERPAFSSVEDAAFQLGKKLENANCLIVIDDVWDLEHLRPFLRGGKSSARLFTTRNAGIASHARPVNVDEMSPAEAVGMLTKYDADIGPTEAADLARRLGEWPLALELAAAMIQERVRLGERASHAAKRLLQIVERRGITVLEDPTAEPRHRTISAVLNVSLELLGAKDVRRLEELSIFPEDVPIPLAAASAVWRLDDLDSEDLAQRFARLSLLKLDLERATLQLHDVMRSWLAARLPDSAHVHNCLLNSWPDWRGLSYEYAWRWLPWHLAQSGRPGDIERILEDPLWMQAKLKATDVNALIGDYEFLKSSPGSELLKDALRLSAHVLATDADYFPSQLIGRLLLHRREPAIARFIENTAAAAAVPWLRPLYPALHPPGTELLRTLEGHSGPVNCVAMTPEGKLAVSASADKTLKVWDLGSGRIVRTLEDHSDSVNGVTVTPDGKLAVSASADKTLKVWDLRSGRVLRTLEGHSGPVNCVVVTPDGKHVVSASWDKTLKAWDLESGRILRTLEGHSGAVNGVAVTPDGKRAVSASWDNTLKVWDLESGRILRTLKGHSAYVNGVVVTPDGKQVVSASWDNTLKVWDLESGRSPWTLEGHALFVHGVTVTPDGKRAVSTSWDNTLKVWDFESGRALCTLEGHTFSVHGAVVTPDGKQAVSASGDHTLKVWNLESDRALHRREGHFDFVNGVTVTPDGKRAVSTSWDKTLKVWDVASGRALRTLEGHSDSINGVAVTPDGKRAISASRDRTLKVWDLESGHALRTLEGHLESVDSVALTPDEKRAVSSSRDKTLKVWDLESGHALRTLEGHSGPVYGVAVTPDGKYVVSTSQDKTLKVWDLESGRILRTMEGHSGPVDSVAVTPDGKHVVSASHDKTLKVWVMETGRTLRTLEGHSKPVSDVAVTADGRRAVSASDDKTLKVWDLESGLPIASFRCDSAVSCCAFADNRTIVAGDQGGHLHFLRFEE